MLFHGLLRRKSAAGGENRVSWRNSLQPITRCRTGSPSRSRFTVIGRLDYNWVICFRFDVPDAIDRLAVIVNDVLLAVRPLVDGPASAVQEIDVSDDPIHLACPLLMT